MISTKYRKQQKERAKEIIAAKRAAKDPTKKDKIKGNKKDHRVRMAKRNERIKQRGLKIIADRKKQIEKLKQIIEESRQKQRDEENGVMPIVDSLTNFDSPLIEVGAGTTDFINPDRFLTNEEEVEDE